MWTGTRKKNTKSAGTWEWTIQYLPRALLSDPPIVATGYKSAGGEKGMSVNWRFGLEVKTGRRGGVNRFGLQGMSISARRGRVVRLRRV